jgi:hypothetical protein
MASEDADEVRRRAVDLFNQGEYREAHDLWEDLWRPLGRQSREGRLLQGLIWLAAAAIKLEEGNRRGLVRHAGRAAVLFRELGEGTLAGYAGGIAEEGASAGFVFPKLPSGRLG